MDYRDLFVRYMAHLIEEEGHDYVPDNGSIMPFSLAEVREIQNISLEAVERRKASPHAWHDPPSRSAS